MGFPIRSTGKAVILLASVVTASQTTTLAAQQPVRWSVNQRASLAWYQINPHYNHLWATTCPEDPAWQPGEGRSEGFYVDYLRRRPTRETDDIETRIPLYPRKTVRSVCRQAVSGEFTATDTVTFRDLKGTVSIVSDSLVSGLNIRDNYARRVIFNSSRFPEIKYTIESISESTGRDTITATAQGKLLLHGVERPLPAKLKIWSEPGGRRVQARVDIPAKDLTKIYQMSELALGMGVGLGRWRTIHTGVDAVLLIQKP